MKLLFDQNLSYRLATRLSDLFKGSTHVRAVMLDRASDAEVWEYAKAHDLCIVTHDSDFAERSRLFGAPPKVIWLRCGNATPVRVESILRGNVAVILELDQRPDLHWVELI